MRLGLETMAKEELPPGETFHFDLRNSKYVSEQKPFNLVVV